MECSACSLSKDRIHVVNPRGSSNPIVLFVGEAPGREEDVQGKPFVGRSGKLLDEWISKIGLSESDYAITNIVWCRPPKNRPPTIEEVKTCSELHLLPYLKTINPFVIIPLGKTATEFIFNNAFNREAEKFITSMSKWVGKPINVDRTTIIPLFHPSYILRTHISIDEMLNKIKGLLPEILSR